VANLSMAAGSLAAGAALLTTGDPATGLVCVCRCNNRAALLYCCIPGVLPGSCRLWMPLPYLPLFKRQHCLRRLRWWRQLRSAAAWGRT
jgi:hypothetical protein